MRVLVKEYPDVSTDQWTTIRRDLRQHFQGKFNRLWIKGGRTKEGVLRAYAAYFDSNHVIHLTKKPGAVGESGAHLSAESPEPADLNATESELLETSASKRGRPRKPFESSAPRSQRRKVNEARSALDPILLRRSAEHGKYPPEEALALILDLSLSKSQYQQLKSSARDFGVDIYPTYKPTVVEAKKQCYPSSLEITDKFASVDLQDILNLTTGRLLSTFSDDAFVEIEPKVTLLSKWGCDGSSNHCQFKQPPRIKRLRMEACS